MLSKSIVVAGADPGSVNFGFAVLRFKGLLELTDAQGNVVRVVPNIEPLAMQRWDIQKGLCTTHSAQWGRERVQVSPARGDRLCDYAPAIGRFVGAVPALFEKHDSMVAQAGVAAGQTLPLIVCENQFDHIKSDYSKTEMLVLSHAFRASVEAVDGREGLSSRINIQAGLKYGLRNDNSLTRPQRKAKADAIVRELFVELGLTEWSAWLERMDAAKEQTHDMCDALLLAIQEAMNRYERLAKDERAALLSLIKTIPKTPTVKRAKKATKTEAATFFDAIERAELDDDHPLIVKPKKGRVLKQADKPPKKSCAKKASDDSGDAKRKRKRATEAPEGGVKRHKASIVLDVGE